MVSPFKLRALGALACLTLLALPTTAFAQEEDEEDETLSYSSVVVQNRRYDATHELNLTLGLLPLDAFTKGVTTSGSYTLHFTQFFAWEIVQFAYSFHLDTDLKDELEVYDLRPTPFEVLDFYASTNAIFKPLYWKGAWNNESMLYGEFFINTGLAYGWFTRSQRPGLDLGVGVRLFTSDLISFKFSARYLMFLGDDVLENFNIKDELWVGLGSSLSF